MVPEPPAWRYGATGRCERNTGQPELPAVSGAVGAWCAANPRFKTLHAPPGALWRVVLRWVLEMRLPRRPYIYFRFVEKAAGEIMLQTGNGKGAILDMQQIVSSVSHFAQLTFWPDGEVAGLPDRLTSNRTCGKPKAGSVLMLWDGETCVLWTGMTDLQLRSVSRFATGLLGDTPSSRAPLRAV